MGIGEKLKDGLKEFKDITIKYNIPKAIAYGATAGVATEVGLDYSPLLKGSLAQEQIYWNVLKGAGLGGMIGEIGDFTAVDVLEEEEPIEDDLKRKAAGAINGAVNGAFWGALGTGIFAAVEGAYMFLSGGNPDLVDHLKEWAKVVIPLTTTSWAAGGWVGGGQMPEIREWREEEYKEKVEGGRGGRIETSLPEEGEPGRVIEAVWNEDIKEVESLDIFLEEEGAYDGEETDIEREVEIASPLFEGALDTINIIY